MPPSDHYLIPMTQRSIATLDFMNAVNPRHLDQNECLPVVEAIDLFATFVKHRDTHDIGVETDDHFYPLGLETPRFFFSLLSQGKPPVEHLTTPVTNTETIENLTYIQAYAMKKPIILQDAVSLSLEYSRGLCMSVLLHDEQSLATIVLKERHTGKRQELDLSYARQTSEQVEHQQRLMHCLRLGMA